MKLHRSVERMTNWNQINHEYLENNYSTSPITFNLIASEIKLNDDQTDRCETSIRTIASTSGRSLSKLCFNPKSLEKYPFEAFAKWHFGGRVIGIYNKNFGYFKYEKSSIAFLYQNVTLGVANVTGGLVFVTRTERVNAMVEMRSNYLLNKNQNFTRDVDSDLLELRSLAKLVGRVHVARIFKLRTRKLMNCSMTLNLPSKAIQDLTCL